MFAEGKNEVDLISEDHQEPTKIGHFLPVSMSKTPPADPGPKQEMSAMSRARITGPFWPLVRLSLEEKFGAKASTPGLTILQREGETGLGLQPADERLSHRGGRGPESSAHRIA